MGNEDVARYHVRRREFLNEDPALPAYVIGIVDDTRAIPDDDPNRSWTNGEIALDFGDCYRRVRFEFYMDTEEDRAHTLRKISLIADVVNAVRDGVALEVTSRNARPTKVETQDAETTTSEPESAAEPHEETAGISQSKVQRFASPFITLGL